MTTGQPAETRPPAAVSSGLRAGLCRLFLFLFVVAVVWVIAVARTGGFTLNFGLFRLRSRNPGNVVIIAALIGALAVVLATPGRRRQALGAELDLLFRLSPVRSVISDVWPSDSRPVWRASRPWR